MEKKPIISIQNLVAGYQEAVILKDITVDIMEKDITVIVGGSGCGKSTLLKHIIGLHRPKAGRVVVDGCDITACNERQYRSLLQRIGVLYQGSALLGSMTVGENVALPLKEYMRLSRQDLEALVRIKLSMVHLDGYANHLPSELSGGMKKRAGLARAMALNPKLLFFDEPSAGLDPITASELDQLILRLNRIFGTTMVVVTHELRSIFTIASRVIMLDKAAKGIIATGTPQELRDDGGHPIVRKFFNPGRADTSA